MNNKYDYYHVKNKIDVDKSKWINGKIIDMIKKYIVDDMEEKDMELFNKKDKYNIDAENNRPRMIYGIPDAFRKQWKEAKAKQDEAKEKYDINSEDSVPQKVYDVPNYDSSQDKIKKESINIVVGKYCLSLTKWDNKCDLLYVNNSETSYSKDSIVSIPITKFDKFCNRLKTIIADWNAEYSGDKNIVWKLKININELNKQINGNGEFPENWNEFIALLSEYEILFKKVLSFDKEGNDEK